MEISNPTVNKALAGNSEIELSNSYVGLEVLSAYNFIEIDNFKWAILADIETSTTDASALISLLSASLFAALMILLGFIGTLLSSIIQKNDVPIDIEILRSGIMISSNKT